MFDEIAPTVHIMAKGHAGTWANGNDFLATERPMKKHDLQTLDHLYGRNSTLSC